MADEVMHFEEPVGVPFTVGDERFEAVADVPVELMLQFTDMVDELDQASMGKKTELFERLFRLLLTEESADRFIARWSDRDRPIGFVTLNAVLPRLMERYGMRPTGPPPSSSGTPVSPVGGTSSAAGTLAAVSTS